jgi:hypothetical protein
MWVGWTKREVIGKGETGGGGREREGKWFAGQRRMQLEITKSLPNLSGLVGTLIDNSELNAGFWKEKESNSHYTINHL